MDIVGNEINNLHSYSFVFQNGDQIRIQHNIINFLHSHFLHISRNREVKSTGVNLWFLDNQIYNLQPGALSFAPTLEGFVYKDNFFNQPCHCTMEELVTLLINANISTLIRQIINNTFCPVNDILSQCFMLPIGVINVKNFSELVCNSKHNIVCEPYNGETKVVNVTTDIFAHNNTPRDKNTIALIIGGTSICILALLTGSFLILIRGSRWLKRKFYFNKVEDNQNEQSNIVENALESIDECENNDAPEDLTLDLLQNLSSKLDDPHTHQEASEMIEQLYQKYVRNNGLKNNNKQTEDEMHLYEELGNFQLSKLDQNLENGPKSILKFIEERININSEDVIERAPTLNIEYSEPSDVAVHLYSELKENEHT